jgi:hypothetical protein
MLVTVPKRVIDSCSSQQRASVFTRGLIRRSSVGDRIIVTHCFHHPMGKRMNYDI